MAFRDSDGRITIDEIAADKDIKQLRSSIEDMQKGLAELQEILAEAEGFTGNTGTQIKESVTILISQINQSIQDTELAISQIQATVSKYQQIDANLKNVITGT